MPTHRGGFDLFNSAAPKPEPSLFTAVFGQYGTILGVVGIFVAAFVGIYFYFKNYGYTVQMGWDRLMGVFGRKDKVDITTTDNGETTSAISLIPPEDSSTNGQPGSGQPGSGQPGSDQSGQGSSNNSIASLLGQAGSDNNSVGGLLGQTGSSNNSVNGSMENPYSQGGSNLPFDPEERPSGMPGAQEGPGFIGKAIRGIESAFAPRQQVFNINRNIYTYDEAAPLCKAMGAELATYEQVKRAQKKGADWCNYGWVKGQMAVYPTSEETWNKIQTGPKAYRNSCGKPGVNGGRFDNPELRFGVNCFGARPEKKDTDTLLFDTETGLPPTAEQIEFDKKVQKFRDEMENITVLPWSRGSWSG